LRQVYLQLRGREYRDVAFKTPALYRLVRHPIMLGMLLTFWATAHMTTGHLFFALGMTIYILIGLHFEERDLLRQLGPTYAEYRQRVPMLVPMIKSQAANSLAEFWRRQ
jgi:protein-S-isoprenylcysteine O-methyltransferase Ste14